MTQREREQLWELERRVIALELTIEKLFEALVGGFDVMRDDLEEADPRPRRIP